MEGMEECLGKGMDELRREFIVESMKETIWY